MRRSGRPDEGSEGCVGRRPSPWWRGEFVPRLEGRRIEEAHGILERLSGAGKVTKPEQRIADFHRGPVLKNEGLTRPCDRFAFQSDAPTFLGSSFLGVGPSVFTPGQRTKV